MPGWLRWLIALGIALLALLLPAQLLPSSDAPQTLAVVTILASIGAALAIVRVFGRRWWHTPTPPEDEARLTVEVEGQIARAPDVLKRTLAQLSASEASFRSLFEVNPAPKVLVRVSDHTIYDGNPAFERITGYKRSEMHGKTLTQLGLWPNAAVRRATWSAVNAALKDAPGQRLLEYDMPGRTRDGSIREMVISVVPVTMSGEPCLLAVMIDQTERLQRERALADSEARYRHIVLTAREGIWQIDADGRCTFANQTLADMLGYTLRELMGHTYEELMDEDSALLARANQERRRQGISEQQDIRLRSKDGRGVWVIASDAPFFDDAGVYLGTLSMLTDITARKRLESQFLQAQKMESVGRLAGGIAHEFNNLLTAINGYAEFLKEELIGQLPLLHDVNEIMRAGGRATVLTRQLLIFARQQTVELIPLRLNDVIVEVGAMLRKLIGSDVELISLPGDGIGIILADQAQIEQVLVNLVVNARDALPDGGTITLSTGSIDLGKSFVAEHSFVKPGPYATVEVADNGVGMTPEVLQRSLDPFFSTKERAKGTGLGLSTSYGIIKQHNGYILLTSDLGKGSRVTLYFPVAVGVVVDDSQIGPRDEWLPRGDETILLAEDEPMVRAFVVRILERYGYTVLAAQDGVLALEMAVAHAPERIDLVVTGVIMPRMSGPALIERMRALWPEVPALYISGYTDDISLIEGTSGGGHGVLLQKPFPIGALVRRVRQALDGAQRERAEGATLPINPV